MAGPIALVSEAGPNDTLNLAQDVGSVGVMPGVAVAGLIGDGPAGRPSGLVQLHPRSAGFRGPLDTGEGALPR